MEDRTWVLQQVWAELVDEGAEGQPTLPGSGEVTDSDAMVTRGQLLTPVQQLVGLGKAVCGQKDQSAQKTGRRFWSIRTTWRQERRRRQTDDVIRGRGHACILSCVH